MFWFFGPGACGILAPQPGIEPAPPALEGKVLTTGPPEKSQDLPFIFDVRLVNRWESIHLQVFICLGLLALL